MLDRVGWARVHLRQAGLVDLPSRGVMHITERGRSVLGEHPASLDSRALMRFEEYRAFVHRSEGEPAADTESTTSARRKTDKGGFESFTPEEKIEQASQELTLALKTEVIDRILDMPPEFFERLILDLMIAMGYGGSKGEAARHLGQTADGGVDGVISQDPLGLDVIYIQAKRYARDRAVGVDKLREFVGALEEKGAAKGVLVTTSRFATGVAKSRENIRKRVVLIDGESLADLLVKYEIGVRKSRSVDLKKLDDEYFEP